MVFAPKKEPFPVFPHHQHETVTKTSTLPHGQKKTRDNNKEKKTKKKKKFSHSSHDTQVRSENKKKKKIQLHIKTRNLFHNTYYTTMRTNKKDQPVLWYYLPRVHGMKKKKVVICW